MVYELLAIVSALIIIIVPYTKYDHQAVPLGALMAAFVVFMAILLFQRGFLWLYYPLLIFAIVRLLLFALQKVPNIFMTALFLSLLVASLFAMLLFPVYQIPQPGGSYAIGTKTYDIVDSARVEQYDDLQSKRKIRVQFWYPADSVEGLQCANWLYDGREIARALSEDSELPYFVLDQLSSVKSNSYINAKISNKKARYPLIILSHGWASIRNLHQDFAEELASRGYVVVGIDHTYGAVATRFDDGRLAKLNQDALQKGTIHFLPNGNRLVNTYGADVSKTIDFIEELNQTDAIFLDKIDQSKIGLLGHSTGGGGDVCAALKDDRIKALIGLDAWLEPIPAQCLKDGLNIPALFLRSEQWANVNNNENLRLLIKNSRCKPLCYQVNQTTHYDFSMVYMYSSAIKKLGYSGKINSAHLTALLKDFMITFFDQALLERVEPKMDMSNYEEVQLIAM